MSNSFADKMKAAAQQTTEQAPDTSPELLQGENLPEHGLNQEAIDAVDNLLANVQLTPPASTGMENSESVVAAQAFNPQASKPSDGMVRSGYYSNTKGKVKGHTAEQLGGRFFFDIEQSDEQLKKELEELVKQGVYEKVDRAE